MRLAFSYRRGRACSIEQAQRTAKLAASWQLRSMRPTENLQKETPADNCVGRGPRPSFVEEPWNDSASITCGVVALALFQGLFLGLPLAALLLCGSLRALLGAFLLRGLLFSSCHKVSPPLLFGHQHYNLRITLRHDIHAAAHDSNHCCAVSFAPIGARNA